MDKETLKDILDILELLNKNDKILFYWNVLLTVILLMMFLKIFG